MLNTKRERRTSTIQDLEQGFGTHRETVLFASLARSFLACLLQCCSDCWLAGLLVAVLAAIIGIQGAEATIAHWAALQFFFVTNTMLCKACYIAH